MTAAEFKTQFDALEHLLIGFSMKLTHNREDARDLFQETAYRAFRNREKFAQGTNFKAWVTTIMRNTFINNYRKRRVRNHVEQPIEEHLEAVRSRATHNRAGSNIMTQELHGMIDDLKENYRRPFLMFYRGFHYKEISEQLDIKIGTVKSRIFFARQQLKEKIRAKYDQESLLPLTAAQLD